MYRTSEPTDTKHTSHRGSDNFGKLEDRGVDRNLNILRLLAGPPIRGPSRSKCIMGGGRSLVAAQIHRQRRLPPSFIRAFLLRPFFSPSVEGEELALWLKGSKRPAIIIPSQMPASPPPALTPPPSPPPAGLPDPRPLPPCTDSDISYKRQRLQQALYCVE